MANTHPAEQRKPGDTPAIIALRKAFLEAQSHLKTMHEQYDRTIRDGKNAERIVDDAEREADSLLHAIGLLEQEITKDRDEAGEN